MNTLSIGIDNKESLLALRECGYKLDSRINYVKSNDVSKEYRE